MDFYLVGLKFKPIGWCLELHFNFPERCVKSRQDCFAGCWIPKRLLSCRNPVSLLCWSPFWKLLRATQCVLAGGEGYVVGFPLWWGLLGWVRGPRGCRGAWLLGVCRGGASPWEARTYPGTPSDCWEVLGWCSLRQAGDTLKAWAVVLLAQKQKAPWIENCRTLYYGMVLWQMVLWRTGRLQVTRGLWLRPALWGKKASRLPSSWDFGNVCQLEVLSVFCPQGWLLRIHLRMLHHECRFVNIWEQVGSSDCEVVPLFLGLSEDRS